MEKITIWHNPRCGKSRDTLALIENAGITPEVRIYLKDCPTYQEIQQVLEQLNIKAEQLVRKKEKIFIEQYKDKIKKETEFIEAMVAHPILIERPIVVKGEHVVLGRPPENVLTLL